MADTDGTDDTRAAYVHSWGAPIGGDEFNYTGSQAELAANGWNLYDGPGHDGNGIRTPSAFSVANGFLRCHGDASMNTGGMDNEGSFSAQYYRVEARMRVNNSGASNGGAEYHSVLILWPDGDIPWPQGGEYDFAEADSNETTMEAFMHHPSTDPGDQNGYTYSDTGLQPAGWTLGDWHNYALEWSPSALKGYIDGVLWFTDTNAVNSNKMHQTIQLDSFHSTGTLMQPVDMDVAWVRFYSITGSGQVGVGSGGTSGGGTGLSDDSIYHTTFEEMSYELTSTAENSTKDWTTVYPYIQDIGDGRGYTCGLVGFTSADGDLLDVVNAYTTLSPGNPLSSYISALTTLKNEGEGSNAGTRANSLLGGDFKTKWASLNGSDPLLRKAQRQIRDTEYWLPALQQALADQVQGLGLAILYDISVNHGPGTDPQSFGGIVATAQAASPPPSQGGSESAYLSALVDARQAVLVATNDYQTDGRVQAHRSLIASGNLTLTAPFSWTMYGDPFTISVRPDLPADAARPNNLEPGAPVTGGSGGGGGGGSGVVDPTGTAPGAAYDLTPWYLTPPNDANGDGVVDEVDYPALATYVSSYFQLDSHGRMVMTSPVQGITTSGSGATRCELREMEAGVHADWAMASSADRQLTVTGVWDPTSITDVKVMIVGQIHGSSGTPPLYLTIDHDHSPPRMRLFKNGPGLADVLTGITTTTKITYRIKITGGRVQFWVVEGEVADLPATPTYDWPASDFTDRNDCYFKFGAYNESDVSNGGTGQAIAYISHYELLQAGTTYTGDTSNALGSTGGGSTGETGGGGTTGGGSTPTFPTSTSFVPPITFSERLVTAEQLQTIPSNLDTLCLLTTGVPSYQNPQTKPFLRLKASSSLSWTSSGLLIPWDTDLQDSDGMFDTASPTLITIKTAGWYFFSLQTSFGTASAGHRQCALTVNSTSLSGAAAVRDEWLGTTSIAHIQCHLYDYFQAGDVVRAYGLSGSTVSSDPDEGGTWLSAIWDGRAADDPVPAYVPLGYGTSGYGTSGYGL